MIRSQRSLAGASCSGGTSDALDGARANSEGDRDHAQALVALHDGLADRLLFPAVSWKTGWGARIRTWDHGTKIRCLTTWPRPIGSATV